MDVDPEPETLKLDEKPSISIIFTSTFPVFFV